MSRKGEYRSEPIVLYQGRRGLTSQIEIKLGTIVHRGRPNDPPVRLQLPGVLSEKSESTPAELSANGSGVRYLARLFIRHDT
jgi:hypothetical protein